ncbi:hypothetical protein LPJ73_008631, partial [Coemansia sp. RSA 2703]
MSASIPGPVPAAPQQPSPTQYRDALMTGLAQHGESIMRDASIVHDESIVPRDSIIFPASEDPEGPFTPVTSKRGPRTDLTGAPARARDPSLAASTRPGATPAQGPKRPLSPASLFPHPRSVMAKTTSKPNPSTRRGPTEDELARERAMNPAHSLPTAWLHFPGAGPRSIQAISEHCLLRANLTKETRPGTPGHPIFSFVVGHANRVGVVFRSIAHLEHQIAHPPVIEGVTYPWRTPEGVFAPFRMIGAPPNKEGRHVLGALRQHGRVFNLQQESEGGFPISDWSGLLVVPEGRAIPAS